MTYATVQLNDVLTRGQNRENGAAQVAASLYDSFTPSDTMMKRVRING